MNTVVRLAAVQINMCLQRAKPSQQVVTRGAVNVVVKLYLFDLILMGTKCFYFV